MVNVAVEVSQLTTFTTSVNVSNFVFTLSYISFLRLAISPSIITISLLTLAINLSPRTEIIYYIYEYLKIIELKEEK